jgi:hypothetical protein
MEGFLGESKLSVVAHPSHRALPYVDPLASRGPLYRAYVRLIGTRMGAWLSPKVVCGRSTPT